MISYREANENDFDLTFRIKTNATKSLVEKIWGWDNAAQIAYHKNQFIPNKIKIIIDDNKEIGYLSTTITEDILFIENLLIDTPYQGRNIGTKVLLDLIKNAVEERKIVELQVLKINIRAKNLYEKLNFVIFEQSALHYKMRYK